MRALAYKEEMQMCIDFQPKPAPQTLLSYGLGQESTDIIVRILQNWFWEKRFRNPDPNKDIILVYSDTGGDWPAEHHWAGNFIEKFLKPNGVKVFYLVHEDFEYRDYIPEDVLVYGFHKVPPIIEWYTSICGIPTRARSSCTDRKKIQPIRRFLSHITMERYGIESRNWFKKVGEKHRMLIGFGAEEGNRVAESNVRYAENIFPLYEAGITRAMSIENIKKYVGSVPQKSGCYVCCNQSTKWFWALREMHPDLWAKAVAMEKKALAKNPKLILHGKLPLEESVNAWVKRQVAKGSLPPPESVFGEAYATKSCW